MTISNLFVIWIGGLLTLMIFSFLYKDNPFYKFAEHAFVGVSAGYIMVVGFWTTLYPNLFVYLFPPAASWVADDPATAEAVINSLYENVEIYWRWGRIVPLIFGCMMLTRLVPKVAWMSRWPMAFIIGYAAGTNLTRYLQSDFVAQIEATMIPIIVINDGRFLLGESFSNFIIVFGVLMALIYFFFSKEHKGWFGGAARSGIWVLMVAFGAAFGFTVMARISLLIGRMEFLGKWIGTVF